MDESTMADEGTYRLAYESLIWAMPMLGSMQMKRELAKHAGDGIALAYLGRPPTGKMVIPTFNNTTAYVFGEVSLNDGPVVIEVPGESDSAKLFGSVMSVWDRPIEDFGPAGIDVGAGGSYVLVPPGSSVDLPDDLVGIDCDSYSVHFWLRSIPSAGGAQGWADANTYAQTLSMYPLADRANPAPITWLDVTALEGYFWGNPMPEFDNFALIDAYVQEEVLHTEDLVAFGMLKQLGIERGKPFRPDEPTRATLERATRDAFAEMEDYLATSKAFVPYWPDRGWGSFRFNAEIIKSRASWILDGALDYHARAKDFFYWAVGLPKRFDASGGGATFYLFTATDVDGNTIDGNKSYRLTVPSQVPVSDFWSIILYSTRTRTFTDSEQFGLSSLDDLDINDDGTVDLWISPTPPDGKRSNWLGTLPGDHVFLTFRFYGPQPALTNKTWVLNQPQLVD